MLKYTSLFSPNEYEKNNKIVLKWKVKMNKIYCILCVKYKKFKNSKIYDIPEKIFFVSIIYSERDSKDEKIFDEEKESMKDIKNSSFTE